VKVLGKLDKILGSVCVGEEGRSHCGAGGFIPSLAGGRAIRRGNW